jgi:uncharacterized phiE125 gp8 family phage protein
VSLRLITPPTETPVSLPEVKTHLRIDHSDEDSYLTSLIAVATATLDGRDGLLGRALMPQTWELVLDQFPGGAIEIPLGPLISVTSVAYVDPDEVAQVVAADSYVADTESRDGWIVPIAGFSWPTTVGGINAVRIRYVAGYETIPAPIKHAVLMIIGRLYASRGETVRSDTKDDPAIQALIAPYRVIAV